MRNNNIALVAILVLVALALYVVLPLPHPAWLARSETPGSSGNLMGLKLGLDLQGGTQVMLEADVAEGQTLASGAIDTAKTIVDNRVNGLGVSEAIVQKQGDNRIIAELPGVNNPDQAIETIRSTGQLEFVTIFVGEVENGLVVQLVIPALRLIPTSEVMHGVLGALRAGPRADDARDELQPMIIMRLLHMQRQPKRENPGVWTIVWIGDTAILV